MKPVRINAILNSSDLSTVVLSGQLKIDLLSRLAIELRGSMSFLLSPMSTMGRIIDRTPLTVLLNRES